MRTKPCSFIVSDLSNSVFLIENERVSLLLGVDSSASLTISCHPRPSQLGCHSSLESLIRQDWNANKHLSAKPSLHGPYRRQALEPAASHTREFIRSVLAAWAPRRPFMRDCYRCIWSDGEPPAITNTARDTATARTDHSSAARSPCTTSCPSGLSLSSSRLRCRRRHS